MQFVSDPKHDHPLQPPAGPGPGIVRISDERYQSLVLMRWLRRAIRALLGADRRAPGWQRAYP